MNEEKLYYLAIGLFVAYLLYSKGEQTYMAIKNTLSKWVDAIQSFEGWQPGSVSYRNNNPGNIKYFGGEQWIGQVDVDPRGFVIFDTYDHGRRALTKLLTNAATGQLQPNYSPDMTLLEFFSRYAPSADNNEPQTYARFVATQIGVNVNDPISTLV